MIQFTRLSFLLGLAGSLAAQTLSFGEVTLVTPVTTPPTYTVNLVLTTAGSAYAGQTAGLQFDLNYAPASLNVTLGLGAAATAASQQLNTVCLGQAIGTCTTPASFNPSTKVAQNNGPGQRAIIIGCCGTGQGTPTSNLIADGVVATLTVQPTATPTDMTLHLPAAYLAGTTQGGTNTAATLIPLTVGAGSNDPNSTGVLDLSKIYQVGDVVPQTGDNVGQFGSALDVNDVIQVLFAVDSVPGYTKPPACTDRFDAMDSAPLDTATVRGGNGSVDVNDVVVTLFRVDSVPGYTAHPMRASLNENGTCTARTRTATSNARRPEVAPQMGGSIVLGAATPAANGQEQIPVYLEGGRDLSHLAFTFALGDSKSALHFKAAAGLAPTLTSDTIPGVVMGAWLGGIDVRAGQRVLLGYVMGPAGVASNLKVFGSSAAGLGDSELVGLSVSGAVAQ
ncbi:MAG TPA: hypothetical protein VHW09_02525 [Bryobacteraceae bacterium]|jgi:hypothetical protein|nr:hypothetical protein [Bryobacteraceae bacterium]